MLRISIYGIAVAAGAILLGSQLYWLMAQDTTPSIARKNNVSISNLMSWNNLISDKIYPKQSLIVSQSK